MKNPHDCKTRVKAYEVRQLQRTHRLVGAQLHPFVDVLSGPHSLRDRVLREHCGMASTSAIGGRHHQHAPVVKLLQLVCFEGDPFNPCSEEFVCECVRACVQWEQG